MTAKQLRASILQLAVQGKLVPQDPADEPASELLARIRAEKARLVKEGKLKKEKNPSEIFVGSDGRTYEKFTDGTTKDISDEIPFDLPRGWTWARLYSVFSLQAGKTISSDRIFPAPSKGMVPCYGGNGIRGYVEASNHEGLYPIIGRQGALCGNINKVSGQFYATEHAVCVETYAQTDVDWCCAFLEALDLHQYATATAQPGLSVAKVSQALIPVPPLAEQKRIVSKIDELIPLLNEYDEAQAAAIIHESTFPDAFRKSVLQAAVQGKLVPQNPTDEPAETMLAQLLADADSSAKKHGKGKTAPSRIFRGSDKRTYETRDGETICIDDEVPFDIPDNWAWVRASSLGTLVRGNGIKRNEATQHGVPCIRYGELYTTYRIRIESVVSRTSAVVAAKAQPVEKNDILLTLTGENKEEIGMADAFLADEPAVAGGDLCVWHGHGQNPLYLAYALMSPFLVKQKAEASNGDIIVHLSAKSASDLLLPLPPIAEQGRIVAEIERLLALGDRLRETS